jgi:hypothetical protein
MDTFRTRTTRQMISRYRSLLACLLFFTLVIYILQSCHAPRKNNTYSEVPDSTITKGHELAIRYCQSCHALPDPSLADVKTWYNGILPEMGPRLGIYRYNFQNYPSQRFDKSLPAGLYPSKALLTDNEWQHIIDYYCSSAPDSLPGQQRPEPIQKQLPFFKAMQPAGHFHMAATSLVKIGGQPERSAFTIADALTGKMTDYDSLMQIKDTQQMGGPIVDQVRVGPADWVVCNIGVLNPNDGRFGKLSSVTVTNGGRMDKPKMVFDSLRRPVKVLEADLNHDGRKDFLVCEFGNMIGALSWLENTGDGKYIRHVLKAVPGAITAVINDYNHDGLPDIWCLFAQGNESISLFTNKGGGIFEERTLIQFPPIYGSSYFELDDFNKDGFPDILYTCGDNADYSAILKPYHGVYIFMNNGKNNFSQKYFFPIDGCYKAMARDFDGDGDLDIASISFFPDFVHQPEESFVYLENQGDLRFKPYSFPEAAGGRWISMDVGDMDGDGKPDILLGNFSIAPAFIHEHADWKTLPPFLILKNTYK